MRPQHIPNAPTAEPQRRLVAALSAALLLTTVLLSGCLFLLTGC
jgi:hypothetical protein